MLVYSVLTRTFLNVDTFNCVPNNELWDQKGLQGENFCLKKGN